MKSSIILTVSLAALTALTSCSSDDSCLDNLIADYDASVATQLKSIDWDTTSLSETEEVPASDNDYVENSTFDYHVNVVYGDGTATVSGDRDMLRSVVVDGAGVTVQSAAKGVEFILSGTTDDGYFKIYSDSKFKIALNGVSITNPSGAAINNQGGKSLYIVLADGTSNTLVDGSTYQTVTGEDEKGTLFSEGQVIFSGSGSLSVTGNYRNGISSDDYIVFRPGNVINVTTTSGHGVKANDGIFVRGGVLNVKTTADGAKGINSDARIEVSGGRTTVITSGGSLVETTDTTSAAGMKCDSSYVQTAGTVNLKSTGEGGKGINSSVDVTISGGTVNVVTTGEKVLSSPKGIKADRNITLSGGTFYVYSANASPIDASGELTIASGYTVYENGSRLVELQY
ncbi:MAG: carbohydrate-binding domain-containing protein [Prevotella sp.]|nr:carbohydrate-binding domain-containing protein [Prevotella sp.]